MPTQWYSPAVNNAVPIWQNTRQNGRKLEQRVARRQRVERETIGGSGPEIAVTSIGDGPVAILLHGIGSSGRSWLPIMRLLARDFRLIMPDMRGHGQSGHPDSGYLLDNYADDLERIVGWAGAPNPIIIGHSLGGLTAITWAQRHPATARAIVLEDMPLSGGPERAPMLEGWAALAAMTVEDAAAHYRSEFPGWSDEDYQRRAEIITSTHQAVFMEMRTHAMSGTGIDYFAGLDTIRSPITLIHGDTETGGLVPIEGARRFAELGPNFHSVRIPGGSHSLHREFAEAFLQALYAAVVTT